MILFDLPIYQFIMSVFGTSKFMIFFMKLITTFGSTFVIITGILCIGILIKNKKFFKIFILANLIGVILNNLIKIIIRRPRPSQTIPFSYEKSYSFPSGHSMMSMIFYGLIIYYIFKTIKNRKFKVFLSSILSIIIIFIGISRIYLGVHYVTDVLGGFIFGIIYLYLFIKLLDKYENRTK